MIQQPRQTLTAPIRRIRFVWMAVFFMAWVCIIGMRLVWLQVIRHNDWVKRAVMQQQRTFPIAPRRGVVYDRNLRELAVTVNADSAFAVPSELGDNKEDAADMLASIVHSDDSDTFTSKKAILARLNASRNFAWVARKLDPETAQRVRELNLKGIYFHKEPKRFYPAGDLSAQVLGYVGLDDNGLGGLERFFDEDLHGTPGVASIAVDAKRHALVSDEHEPLPGQNLVLTIDANIQYIAERALDKQMEKMKADHGTVVVQDPHTGHILALAISPRYNPNDLRKQDPSILKNLAVSDVYEPGSTFKLLTYSAAIDGAGVEPTDIVDCQGGAMTMFGRTLHDDKTDHFGRVTVQYALEHSSDVGAAKMALKLGNQKFYEYIKSFGFGDRTGIELPSETRGLLRPAKKWEATSVLSIAIGHEVAVTPVQLVTMVSTIANGGTYIPPHIVLSETEQAKGDPRLQPVAFHPSNQLAPNLPDGTHRVIKELTAAKMRNMMHGTVVEGTGKMAALNGYSAGGKTGTAQKIDPVTHTYSHTHTVASFAGIAPISSPAISVAVIIDNPTVGTRYGAETSAPVFKEVAQQTLEYLGVPHDQPLSPVKSGAQQQTPIHIAEDNNGNENEGDLNALFAEVNSLPDDDPLKSSAAANAPQAQLAPPIVARKESATRSSFSALSSKVIAAFKAHGSSVFATEDNTNAPLKQQEEHAPPRPDGSIVVSSGRKVAVPDMQGASLRNALEKARAANLRIQPVGSGLATQQVPAAGAMVSEGTEIIVRFAR